MKNFIKQLTYLLSASRRPPGKLEDRNLKIHTRNESVYARILEVMSKEKPYLDENMNLERFSVIVAANQTYVSNAINDQYGSGFRHFLNAYRVSHCMELLTADKRIKVSEAASQSGFKSIVTFNTAFKRETGQTPTSYFRQTKARKTEQEPLS